MHRSSVTWPGTRLPPGNSSTFTVAGTSESRTTIDESAATAGSTGRPRRGAVVGEVVPGVNEGAADRLELGDAARWLTNSVAPIAPTRNDAIIDDANQCRRKKSRAVGRASGTTIGSGGGGGARGGPSACTRAVQPAPSQ